jgi:transcriptional antiterminator RfaH
VQTGTDGGDFWTRPLLFRKCCCDSGLVSGVGGKAMGDFFSPQERPRAADIFSTVAVGADHRVRRPHALQQMEAPFSTPRSAVLQNPSDDGTSIADKFSSKRWYVLHSRPRAESRAVVHLEMQGYRVFCPRYRKVVRHARKAGSVLAPLFSSYLFLNFNVARDQWRAINGTPYVERLIMQGETPQPVQCGIVESLQSRMRADGAFDWTRAFKIGQAVRLADGPFTDFVGTLAHLDAAGRVRVLLELLGRSVSVALHGEALIPAA